jgi:DnaJ-class molecular chaperone
VHGAEFLVIAGAVAVGAWWVDVRRHPVRRCPSCNGSKKNTGSSGKRWGTCRRCKGKGEVRRFGAPRR